MGDNSSAIIVKTSVYESFFVALAPNITANAKPIKCAS